jgi:hypothetical protein
MPICPTLALLERLQTLHVAKGWSLKLSELHFMFWIAPDHKAVAVTCDTEPEFAICLYGEVPPSNEVFAQSYSEALGLDRLPDPDRKHDER